MNLHISLSASALAAAVTLTAAGCGGDGSSSQGGGTKIRVASVLAGQAGYVTALIERQEIDKRHGIDLEVMDLGFEESANALRQGRADLAMMSPNTMLRLSAEQDFDSVVIGPFNWSGNAWVVQDDSPYQSLSDLRGERIGNFPRTTGAFFFSAVLADADGLDIEEDFEPVEADVSPLVALLEKGEVQAANLFEPHVSKLLALGDYRVVLDFDKEFEQVLGARPLKTAYAATPEWVDGNPEAVDAVQQTFADAIDTIASGKDEEFFDDNAEELFGLTEDAQLEPAYERNRTTLIGADDWSRKDIDVQNDILQEGVGLGLIPDPPDGWRDDLWLDCYFDCPPRGQG